MKLIKDMENIADKYHLSYRSLMLSVTSQKIQMVLLIAIISLTVVVFAVNAIIISIIVLMFLKTINQVYLMPDHVGCFTFKEDFIILKYILTSPKKKTQINEELKAYLEVVVETENQMQAKGFIYIAALQDDKIKLAEWVAKYVRKETSIVNHFVARLGNPVVQDMSFIRLLIWSQLIPIKKFDINDLRMVLSANPDINHEVLKANSVPMLTQTEIVKIFNNYSSQDLNILLTGDFSIENYLNVVRRSYKMGLELPVMKSVRELIKYLHLMEKSNFVIKDWQKTIVETNTFEMIEAITTKDSLFHHKGYFKNCIQSYANRLGAGEGMLFVAYQQGIPHIVFYVDEYFKLGDATYRFNYKISNEDRHKLQNICKKAKEEQNRSQA